MNAIANVATNVERAGRQRANPFLLRQPPVKINRQAVYAVREVSVTYHRSAHRDAHYVILA